MNRGRPLTERFWEKVAKGRPDECWLWTGSTKGNGYGQIRRGATMGLAHRVSYELNIGPIPERLQIDHLCRVRHCVNPAHLEPVTGSVNQQRGWDARGPRSLATRCQRGHAFTAANTYLSRKGRCCRECRRISARRCYRAKRGA